MKIEVTQKHIDDGQIEECDACPIALAIKEKMNPKCISVDSTNIMINNSYIKTPAEVAVLF